MATACFDQRVRLWKVRTLDPLERNYPELQIDLNILEKPIQENPTNKPSIYETEMLDDEALALILRPEKKVEY